MSERLRWNEVGLAHDEATGLTVQVEKGGNDPARPWTWFFGDWPVGPNSQPGDFLSGKAATEEDARRDAESALPTAEEIARLREKAEAEYEAIDAAKGRGAAG
jgi:hypothetical protein